MLDMHVFVHVVAVVVVVVLRNTTSRIIPVFFHHSNWLVVWNKVCFSLYWEESSQLTNIFQRGG